MTDDARCKKLTTLLTVQRELLEKLAACTAEMDDLCGGGVGIGAKLKDLGAAWQEAWGARYKADYVVSNYGEYNRHWKTLLKTLSVEEIKVRILNYIKASDPFYTRAQHDLRIFVRNINSFAPVTDAGFDLADEAPAVGCKHTPRCKSDVEHTQRRSAEMRAAV